MNSYTQADLVSDKGVRNMQQEMTLGQLDIHLQNDESVSWSRGHTKVKENLTGVLNINS